jgi:pimeloyl-ACP methyl ester carboxylesterase
MGNWRQTGGVESALRALNEAIRIANIDADQVYLAGLSNGGLGVSLLADGWPERFKGLIFISPVMAEDILDRSSFQDAWRDRPVLVIAGEEDRNIPLGYVNEQVLKLREGGVDVTLIPYAGEDHFLFFTRRGEVSDRIIEWLEDTR